MQICSFSFAALADLIVLDSAALFAAGKLAAVAVLAAEIAAADCKTAVVVLFVAGKFAVVALDVASVDCKIAVVALFAEMAADKVADYIVVVEPDRFAAGIFVVAVDIVDYIIVVVEAAIADCKFAVVVTVGNKIAVVDPAFEAELAAVEEEEK